MPTKAPTVPEQIKGRLRGTSRLRTTLSDIRREISPSRFPALIAWLPLIRHDGRGVFSGQYPTHLTRLKRDWPLEPIQPEHEITWATEVLRHHSPRVNLFINRSREYEKTLLGGDYLKAGDFLDSMEQEFGYSLWSIENRIALLQAAYGLERQKAYVSTIRKARVSNALAVIAFFTSERNEPVTNPAQFKRQMAERAQTWEVPRDYTTYLLFRIADICEFNLDTCAAILRFEATSSVVDYYDTFIRLAQKAALTMNIQSPFLPSLEALGESIADHRICKILLLNNPPKSRPVVLLTQQIKCQDYLVQEQFKPAAAAAELSLRADPMDVSLHFVSAQAHSAIADELTNEEKTDGGGLGSRIKRLSSLLVSKEESTEDPYLEALRLTSSFRLMNFPRQLERFVNDNCTHNPISKSADALYAFLQNPYLDPRDLPYLPKTVAPAYAKLLLETYGPSPSVAAELLRTGAELPDFDEASAERASAFGKDSLLQIKIHTELNHGHYDLAFDLSQKLERSQNQHARRLAARYTAHCLLRLGNLTAAIDYVVAHAVSDPPAAVMLPVAECAEGLDKATRKILAAKLSTPIILDLFSRNVSDRLDNVRAYAYEDFLIANGLERPSEISRIAERLDRKLLIYYLRRICTPAIMQVSSAFRGSQELEQERLEVCSLLRQIDEPSVKEYEAEIRDITRNQAIHLGLRHVNKSRIFVDLTAIRRWAERNLKERFTRYRALLEAGIDTGVNAFADALEDALDAGTVAQTVLALPKNEANDLLADLVSKVFAECMTNPEYGLDCYLSMRIRHGALSGQLRGPLEEEKIITQRESGSQKYKSNEFWLQRLDDLWPTTRYQVDARLAQFSREYDSAIDEFAGEFIQVHSAEKESGLFSKALPELFLGAIAAEIKQDTTFDDFIDLSFNWFWQRVELDLKTIRKKIDEQLKPKINALFANLQSDIETLARETPTAELDRAIRTAQTGAQNALNQVNEWFRLRKPESVPSFALEDIIDIGLKCVTKIHPDFRPQISQTIPSMPRLIRWTPLSDIFFIVFENIQKHSGMITPSVEIAASESNEEVRIMIKSELDVSVHIAEAQIKIGNIKRAISEGSYQRGVRSEGGTGLMKLRRIIGQNPKKPNHLDFGFTSDRRFFVELELPYRELPDEDTGR